MELLIKINDLSTDIETKRDLVALVIDHFNKKSKLFAVNKAYLLFILLGFAIIALNLVLLDSPQPVLFIIGILSFLVFPIHEHLQKSKMEKVIVRLQKKVKKKTNGFVEIDPGYETKVSKRDDQVHKTKKLTHFVIRLVPYNLRNAGSKPTNLNYYEPQYQQRQSKNQNNHYYSAQNQNSNQNYQNGRFQNQIPNQFTNYQDETFRANKVDLKKGDSQANKNNMKHTDNDKKNQIFKDNKFPHIDVNNGNFRNYLRPNPQVLDLEFEKKRILESEILCPNENEIKRKGMKKQNTC